MEFVREHKIAFIVSGGVLLAAVCLVFVFNFILPRVLPNSTMADGVEVQPITQVENHYYEFVGTDFTPEAKNRLMEQYHTDWEEAERIFDQFTTPTVYMLTSDGKFYSMSMDATQLGTWEMTDDTHGTMTVDPSIYGEAYTIEFYIEDNFLKIVPDQSDPEGYFYGTTFRLVQQDECQPGDVPFWEVSPSDDTSDQGAE